MQYMLIHAVDEGTPMDEQQAAQDHALLAAWLDETIRRGIDLHGSRLRPTTDATTVRVRGGETLVSDGPFAETKEQVAGYDVLECASAEEAIEWASKHPTVLGGAIEVRPLAASRPPAPLPARKDGKMRYVMFVCLGEDFAISPQDAADIGPATDAWVSEMDGRGVRLFGSQLEGVEQAHTVRLRGDQVLVTDGPFAETKEQIAGFDVLECADLDEALEVAAKHPMTAFGMMELRPFWPSEAA